MSNWLSRLFTIPRKEREKIAQIPGIHALGTAVRGLAISVAQNAVDKHLPAGEAAERIKAEIEADIEHAIPIPIAQEGPPGTLVEGLIAGVQKLVIPPGSPTAPGTGPG